MLDEDNNASCVRTLSNVDAEPPQNGKHKTVGVLPSVTGGLWYRTFSVRWPLLSDETDDCRDVAWIWMSRDKSLT